MKKNRVGSRLVVAAALAALAMAIAPSTTARADPTPALSDPASLMARYAPDEITPTSPDTKLVVSSNNSESDGSSFGASESTVTVKDSSVGGDIAISPSPDVDYAGSSHGYEVFTNEDVTLATYVKAVPQGAQTIFAASVESALSGLSIRLSAPIVQHVDGGDGVQLLTLGDGKRIALYPAWARDALGRELHTSYSISASTISQSVKIDSETIYPVIADPAWSYVRTYGTGATSPAKAKSLLHSCFNCRFPVSGAPRAFPSPGQNLPLFVGPVQAVSLNFHCTFDSEFSSSGQGQTSWGFRFRAASGHVDGIGSTISFTVTGSGGANSLAVYGYIVNDAIAGIARDVYVNGASATWASFAANLRKG
jgi:hypothetical protein